MTNLELSAKKNSKYGSGATRRGCWRRVLALNRIQIVRSAVAAFVGLLSAAHAENKYGPGVTDTEIKIGNTVPYSGGASAYGTIGKTEAAYFKMINETGGINGRKINFISYDDAQSPPKTVEQVRKLVEGDEVLFLVSPVGTASNTAIRKYLNQKGVPQLFVATGATKWGDPAHFPWTMGFPPNYQSEARIYAKYLIEHHPDAKIAVLYQNDDAGKDSLKGLQDGLGSKAGLIVSSLSFEITDPTIDSQIVASKNSGAEVMITFASSRTASQSIKKVGELGWKPVHIIGNVAASIATVLRPAGLDNAKGLLSTAYFKDPTSPDWGQDPGLKRWLVFMEKYFPEGDKTNSNNVYGYLLAQTAVQVLKQCGDDLSRDNVMKQAANLRGFAPDMLLPGITIDTSPDDYFPIEQMQMIQFDGTSWRLIGGVIQGEVGH